MDFEIDPANKIVQLCTEGMNAEFEGDTAKASGFFKQAWQESSNDFEAFIAAHYMARCQNDLSEKLRWNLESLQLAGKITDKSMKKYLPSLCLNVGKSYEELAQNDKALSYYQQAADYAQNLPENPYSNMIKSGIAAGLKRMNKPAGEITVLEKLIDNWCERRDLKPLSFVLPTYVNSLNTPLDKGKLVSALGYLSASRCLPDSEQEIVLELITSLTTETNS